MRIIRCPICDGCFYKENYSVSTAMYYPPIFKDGININPDKNVTTTYCQCLICGNSFDYQTKGGELINE